MFPGGPSVVDNVNDFSHVRHEENLKRLSQGLMSNFSTTKTIADEDYAHEVKKLGPYSTCGATVFSQSKDT